MKKLLFILLLFLNIAIYACHLSYLTLISGPTSVGGGKYSTTIQVCIGQTANWGGTQSFTLTLTGATYFSFAPATVTNNYNAYNSASCAGPNCFMSNCTAISATATGSITSTTVVTYNTTSSTPAGFPIVPDDNETCGANSANFCFNFTFVTNGFPSTITLGGNLERLNPKICRQVCGFPLNANASCNGVPEADETISFTPLSIELDYFKCNFKDGNIELYWSTITEENNDYFIVQRSVDGINWEDITNIDGAGNSNYQLYYEYIDEYPELGWNYYRLIQVDINGTYNYDLSIIACYNDVIPVLIGYYNLLGQEIKEPIKGVYITKLQYNNHIVYKKIIKLE